MISMVYKNINDFNMLVFPWILIDIIGFYMEKTSMISIG